MTGHDYCVGVVAGLAVLTFAVWQWRELAWRSALRENNAAWAKMLRENTDESRSMYLGLLNDMREYRSMGHQMGCSCHEEDGSGCDCIVRDLVCAHANKSAARGWCNDCGERLIKPPGA